MRASKKLKEEEEEEKEEALPVAVATAEGVAGDALRRRAEARAILANFFDQEFGDEDKLVHLVRSLNLE